MKYAKMVCLVAVAAMALMAVVASSASANAKVCSTVTTNPPNTEQPTVNCKANHGVVYSGKVVATLEAGTSALLKATRTSGETVTELTCTSSESEGSVNGTTGTGSITKLTFGGCSSPLCPNGVSASTTASAGSPWAATATTTIAGTENTNGILDVSNPTGQFDCIDLFGVHHICKYTVATASPHITGSHTNPTLKATNIQLNLHEGSTLFCGNHASWNAAYKITTPSSLIIE